MNSLTERIISGVLNDKNRLHHFAIKIENSIVRIRTE